MRTGDALPSESQLCEKFQVSRITVRQALHQLQLEGLVLPKQGKGTFVRSGPIEHELGEFHTLTEVLARHGYPRDVELLSFAEARPPRAVAEELELGPSDRCVLVKRRHLMGRQPVALTVMYFAGPSSASGRPPSSKRRRSTSSQPTTSSDRSRAGGSSPRLARSPTSRTRSTWTSAIRSS